MRVKSASISLILRAPPMPTASRRKKPPLQRKFWREKFILLPMLLTSLGCQTYCLLWLNLRFPICLSNSPFTKVTLTLWGQMGKKIGPTVLLNQDGSPKVTQPTEPHPSAMPPGKFVSTGISTKHPTIQWSSLFEVQTKALKGYSGSKFLWAESFISACHQLGCRRLKWRQKQVEFHPNWIFSRIFMV